MEDGDNSYTQIPCKVTTFTFADFLSIIMNYYRCQIVVMGTYIQFVGMHMHEVQFSCSSLISDPEPYAPNWIQNK